MRRRDVGGGARMLFVARDLKCERGVATPRRPASPSTSLNRDMSLVDLVQQQLGQGEIAQISEQLGIAPSAAQTAVQAAVPLMIGGMAGVAQQPAGAQAVQSAVDAHAGSSGVLGSLGGLLGGGGGSGGSAGALASAVLGQRQSTVQQGVQPASGLDSAKVQQLIAMLAPVVMAAISQHQASAAPQTARRGIGALLEDAAQAAASQGGGSSPLGGLLGKFLGGAQ